MHLRLKVTDQQVFAKELIYELNKESEDGTTAVHRMFDGVIKGATEWGVDGIELHEDQGS
jgi:hypothetical protein